MSRWDDLRRAILARDNEGAEQVWLELVESDPDDLHRFLETADLLARQPGGRRQAGILLWLLADALEENGRHRWRLSVLGKIASLAPDDGTGREAAEKAARAAYPERGDLDMLLEKSGVVGGEVAGLAEQIEALERYLRIELGAWVWHRSGWGAGKVIEYHPDRGRCVIDFRERKGHEMDIEAAANLLERLPEDDVRVQAVQDPRGLRKRVKEQPLAILAQVLGWYRGEASLRSVKNALVPDAVAPSTWSTWWKEAKRHAVLDPRFHVGPGRDPRIEMHAGEMDFRTQLEAGVKRGATVAAKQKVIADLASTTAGDAEARAVLVEVAERERDRGAKTARAGVGWVLLLARIHDQDPVERVSGVLATANDPLAVVKGIGDARARAQAAQAYLRAREEGAKDLLAAAREDDPVLAEVGIEAARKQGLHDDVSELIDRVESKPALLPNLYAWYLRALRKGRLTGRDHDPYRLVLRVLKVLDGVEYRSRRGGSARDKRAVGALNDLLDERGAALVQEAAEATDEAGARHLLRVIDQNRGLRGAVAKRLNRLVSRVHPEALRAARAADAQLEEVPAAVQPVYMTPQGMEALRVEATRLESEEIPANAAEIARAREFGDLKENAEYHAAREKAGMLQAKVDALKSELARAVPITADIVRTDAVSVGSRVKLQNTEGSVLTYTLLGPPDADMDAGVINYLTPLGQALMGAKQGETVAFDVDGAKRELRILEIENAVTG